MLDKKGLRLMFAEYLEDFGNLEKFNYEFIGDSFMVSPVNSKSNLVLNKRQAKLVYDGLHPFKKCDSCNMDCLVIGGNIPYTEICKFIER